MKKSLKAGLILLSASLLVACSNEPDTADDTSQEAETTEVAKDEEEEHDHEDDHDHDHDHDDEDDHDHDHDHTHGEYAWIGEFEFEEGTYLLHFGESEEETMDIGFVLVNDNVTDLEHHAEHLMAIEDADVIEEGDTFEAKPDYMYILEMDPEHGHFDIEITKAGRYAIVTEVSPKENSLQVFDGDTELLPEEEIFTHEH